MDIAYGVDANYFFYARVSVESVLRHAGTPGPTFWIVSSPDVTDSAKEQLTRQVGDRGRVNFVEVDPPDHGVSSHPSVPYVTSAMYLRLHLVGMLPETVERIVYLDADVLCTSTGLDHLAKMDMGGCVLAAARDATTRRMIDKGGLPGLQAFPGIDPQDLYFNSGVLVISTSDWVHEGIAGRCDAYLDATAHDRRFPDQDALNATCHGRWLRLNKMWNHQQSHRLDTHRGDQLDEAVLVHFNTTVKPWHDDYPTGYRKELFRYYAERAVRDGRDGPVADRRPA